VILRVEGTAAITVGDGATDLSTEILIRAGGTEEGLNVVKDGRRIGVLGKSVPWPEQGKQGHKDIAPETPAGHSVRLFLRKTMVLERASARKGGTFVTAG
jgi:hypothetical protein